MHKQLQPEFSIYTDEGRARNPCTFLPRHSTDITEYISSQSLLWAPKRQNVTLLAFLPDTNHLCLTKEKGFHLGVWKCLNVHLWVVWVCVSVCIRQGGKIKAAGEACLQSFKSLTCLLYLSDQQFFCLSALSGRPFVLGLLKGSLFWTAVMC